LAVPPVRRCPQEILRTCALEQAGDNMPILSVNTELDFSLPYRVLAFYAIAPVAAPDDAVAEHRQYLVKHDMVGRVYICADGLNAQVSGTTASCEAYRAFAAAAFPGIQLLFKEDPVAEPAFPKLRVKHKALVPGEAVDLNARGEDLEPERWAAMISWTPLRPSSRSADSSSGEKTASSPELCTSTYCPASVTTKFMSTAASRSSG
jgi:hypothetical protein